MVSLPRGSTVTVTASPSLGLNRTLDLSLILAQRGYHVVPHLAARMVESRGHLERLVERLDSAGVHEVFVVGGDAAKPAGGYADAGDLLEELAGLAHPFARIGIGGYPEGHPVIADDALLAALQRKQPFADYLVTQICFDADTLVRWIRNLRAAGVDLPVIVGLPGAVERRRLVEVSLKTGVGGSLRYLRKHGRALATLARARRYDPTSLAVSVAAHVGEPDLAIRGAHLFTFNQVESTSEWVARAG